ncbi:transposase [Streptomyces sp. NPDC001668]|uniref:transposase n=1 Tax=unclassified Streptomyces TaxID=2593676 RepID=UPI003697DB66
MGKRRSRPWSLSVELWSLIAPLLPEPPPEQVEGRPRVPDGQALCGILFVLHTGIQWEYLPQEWGFGSGMTCWRRLAAWNEAGRVGPTARAPTEQAAVEDPAGLVPGSDRLLPRPGRTSGPKSGPSPVDRARPSGKHHTSPTAKGSPSPRR